MGSPAMAESRRSGTVGIKGKMGKMGVDGVEDGDVYPPDANTSVAENRATVPSPKFTRSWTLEAPAEERKVKLADLRKKGSLQVNVNRALARSWSFTKTTRSPAVQDRARIGEAISLGDVKETEELQEELSRGPGLNRSSSSSVEEEMEKMEKRPYKVSTNSRTWVVPARPGEKQWLPLNNLDRIVNPTFSSVIHYYKGVVTAERSFREVSKFLKATLAEALVPFYPMAGRLTLLDDGKVDLHCNGAGALWIEAAVDATLEEFGGANPSHQLSGLDVAGVGAGPLYIPDQLSPMPVLIIQATRFACGTLAIATNWHHTVADGFSGMHFLRSWAEISTKKPVSLPPVHDRGLLKARRPPNPTLVNGYSTKSMEEYPGEEVSASTAAPVQLEKFDLGKEAIAQLKTQANLAPPPFTPRPYTSAESISGHLWRQMTKARAAANSYSKAGQAKDQTTKFFMFVDGRKRLGLSPGFFGNVVCSACAVAREADILDNPLHFAASLIRTSTRNITEEYFRSLIDWVELQGMSNSKSEHVNSLGHDVAATFWTFFPLYEVEFGWGRPLFAARNSPPRRQIDGIAMMPDAQGKGMVALLNLHVDRMSKLQRQISFSTVFHH